MPFTSVNAEVLEYYVDALNQDNLNRFSIDESINTVGLVIDAIDSTINKFNNLPIRHLINEDIDKRQKKMYLDQPYLNKLHADWVNIQKKIFVLLDQKTKYKDSHLINQIQEFYSDDISRVVVGDVIHKLGIKSEFNSINLHIHEIESHFSNIQATVDTSKWMSIPNVFPKTILSHNIANLSFKFNHLGRTLYNKFYNFDFNFEYQDENSYDQLLKFITIKLVPPETIQMSPEYIKCCRDAGREPVGKFLNIGNLVDLSNRLTEYRQIVYNNALERNKFSFELIKE